MTTEEGEENEEEDEEGKDEGTPGNLARR